MSTELKEHHLKLVLLSPKGPLYRHDGGIFRKSLRAAPLTLTTLAALVPEDLDIEIRLIDEGIEPVPTDLKADMVAMTVITGSAMRAYELARCFRQTGICVVLGGPHVTLMPDEASQHADAIVTGYAEATWPQLLRDFVQRDLKPRYDMAFDFRLRDYPVQARRDLLKGKGYSTIHTFEATRGCVHDCEFCVVPSAWGRVPFQKDIAHVVDDIRQSGAKRLVFYDLNLIANRQYAKELFEALEPLKVKWFGLATTLIDDDMAERMARSGCRGLLIGFESVSTLHLEISGKVFNRPALYGDLIRKLQNLGILINGTFVFGNDADQPNIFDETLDFVLEHRLELPRFAILTPFPGTPLFNRLDAAGRVLHRDWSLYDGQHVVFQPQHMSTEELLAGHERVWRNVYSAKGIMRRISKQCLRQFSMSPIIFGANIGYRFYAHHLHRFYTCTGGTI